MIKLRISSSTFSEIMDKLNPIDRFVWENGEAKMGFHTIGFRHPISHEAIELILDPEVSIHGPNKWREIKTSDPIPEDTLFGIDVPLLEKK